jgi:hypothetical protein
MVQRRISLIALFSVLLLTGAARAAGLTDYVVPSHTCVQCGQKTYGTAITWVESPTEAANRAQKEEKLVFVLHVSGHFEEPGYT